MRREVEGGEGRTGSAERVSNRAFLKADTHWANVLSLTPVWGDAWSQGQKTQPVCWHRALHTSCCYGHCFLMLTPTHLCLL